MWVIEMSPSRFRLRRVFRGVVLRIASPLAQRGVRPDTVTYFSLFLSFMSSLSLMITHCPQLFGVLVFLAGLFDGVDGAVARMGGRSTPAGPLVDSVTDKVSEAIIIMGVALSAPSSSVLGIGVDTWSYLCLFGWLMTSYTRSRAQSLGVEDLDVGLGARSERLFTLFVFAVAGLLVEGLAVVAVLGMLTAAYRYNHYLHQILGASRGLSKSEGSV